MQGTRGASLSGEVTKTGKPVRRRVGVLAAVAAVVIALDQITKIIALDRLADGHVVPIIDGILRLRLVRNPGAAFGLAGDFTFVLALIVIGVILVILRMSRRLTSLAWAVALGGMLGGAIGNLIDRIFREPGPLRGHVIDFVELTNWPVFNVADSAVVGGAVLIAILSLRGVTHDGVDPNANPGPASDPAESGQAESGGGEPGVDVRADGTESGTGVRPDGADPEADVRPGGAEPGGTWSERGRRGGAGRGGAEPGRAGPGGQG